MKRFSQALNKVIFLKISCKNLNDDMTVGVFFQGGRECRLRRSLLARQQTFIDRLVSLVKNVARESGNRKKKVRHNHAEVPRAECRFVTRVLLSIQIERLQALLADQDSNKMNFINFEPLPLPLDPEVKIQGIMQERASLFKSALMPCRLTFKMTNKAEYVTIFKHGDDLRQDQLIQQIITLMDKVAFLSFLS